MIRAVGSLLLILLVAGAAAPGSAAPAGARHSGMIVFIDAERGVLVLDEVGPWRVVNGRTVTTRLTIDLTRETRVNTFIRVDVPGRFAGDFLEVALDPADLTPGDVVTVDCLHEPGRLVAAAVTLAALD